MAEPIQDVSPGFAVRVGQLGGATAADEWRRETAVLRLIAAVEAYTNSASAFLFAQQVLPAPKEPFTWPQRKVYFKKNHTIELIMLSGWDEVEAGIDLRNCLAHGLGNLTELLVTEKELGTRMRRISVNVGGNRLHTTVETVPILADACQEYVLALERELVKHL